MSERQRLFFALWPTEHQQRHWAKLVRERLTEQGGRAVPWQNLHITLVFLGGVESGQYKQIIDETENLLVPQFALSLDRLNYRRRARMLWWGVSQVPQPMLTLVEGLRKIADRHGVDPERRPYLPHMTLIRNLRHAPPELALSPQHWQVGRFVMACSHTYPEGAQYQVLKSWPLA